MRARRNHNLTFIISLLLSCAPALAQEPIFEWVRTMVGDNGGYGYAVVKDGAGNLYVGGRFIGLVDFDPGTGVHNMIASQSDAFIAKYDASGSYIWAKQIGAPNDQAIEHLELDQDGNLLLSGYFDANVIDFDPGAGVYNVYGSGFQDAFICKLTADGNFLWIKKIGNAYNDAVKITTDSFGNIYATGTFYDTIDFDPSAAVFNLTAVTATDLYLLKLDPSGNFIWVKTIAPLWDMSARDITTGPNNEIYLTGSFSGPVDFDPGTGTTTLTAVGLDDFYICRFDANGNLVWARAGGASGMDVGQDITTDHLGNVIVSGYFNFDVDFDLGPGTHYLTAGNEDIFVLKLDAFGNSLWAINSPGLSLQRSYDLAIGENNEIYLMGTFGGTINFALPGGNQNFISVGGTDTFITCIEPTGNYRWAKQLGGSGSVIGFSLFVDSSGNVYSTGGFANAVDFNPSPLEDFNTDAKGIYFHKLGTSTLHIQAPGYLHPVLYPNPASKTFFISNIQEGLQITLYDLSGKKVLESSRLQESVDVSSLPKGMYTCIAKDAQQQILFTDKIIVQ